MPKTDAFVKRKRIPQLNWKALFVYKSFVSFDILEPQLEFIQGLASKQQTDTVVWCPEGPLLQCTAQEVELQLKKKKHEKTKSVLSGVLEEDTV